MIATQLDAAYAPWLDLFLSCLQLTKVAVPVYVDIVNVHSVLVVLRSSGTVSGNTPPGIDYLTINDRTYTNREINGHTAVWSPTWIRRS